LRNIRILNDSPEYLLKLSGVNVQVANKILFSDVNLILHPGEQIAITGQSGSGKTTLLRTIAGLIDLQAGSILFKEKSIDSYSMPQYRREVVLINQQPVLFKGTVRENLERPFKYKVAGKSGFTEDEVSGLMAQAGLDIDMLNQEALELSVGQKQRVCLIRALLLHPAVLMLDEPTSALDEESEDLVNQLIQSELQNGTGVLTVTHNYQNNRDHFDEQIKLAIPDVDVN